MLQVARVLARHRLADRPADMPVGVLLALPAYSTRDAPADEFPDPFAALDAILYAAGPEEAERIFRPRVWAPGWSVSDVRRVTGTRLWGARPPDHYRSLHAPLDPAVEPPRSAGDVSIVHLVGRVESREDGVPSVVVEDGERRRVSVGVEGLRDALMTARTRLLVLHPPPLGPPLLPEADDLARGLVERGGPAVLVLGPLAPRGPMLQTALETFYRELVHDTPLTEAVYPFQSGTLHLGEGGDDLLQLHPYVQALMQRLEDVSQIAERVSRSPDVLDDLSPYLHRRDAARMEETATDLADLAGAIREGVPERRDRLDSLAGAQWHHEGEGVIPVSREVDALEGMQARAGSAAARYEAMKQEIEAAASRAPRVMNANLADPAAGRVLVPTDPLREGRSYELLVDVGPRWNTIPTLVRGAAEFPERALPPGEDGYALDLVLVAEDLERKLVTARIWLPAERGRSHPMEDDGPAPDAGPVALPFTPAPGRWDEAGGRADVRTLSARLSVHFRGTLLQSARVLARVARREAVERPPGENRIDVDFAVTGTFQDLAEEFSGRALTLGGRRKGLPMGASITLNGDGSGGHRLVITSGGDGAPLAAGWTPYNPVGAGDLLRKARTALLECFYQGEGPNRRVGLDRDNGKAFDEFRLDLRRLALLGRELYGVATAQAHSDRGGDARDFSAELRTALAEPRVIQVGRTVLAEYAFPWALVYDIPLPGPTYRFCKVMREWQPNGRRTASSGETCPFATEPWHRENIFCPYGFWGLRHVVEQPLSVVDPRTGEVETRNVPREMHRAAEPLEVGVAVTEDTELDGDSMLRHLRRLEHIRPCRLVPTPPAADVDRLRGMLPDASVVYFLCHGEVDPADGKPYLGIGPRDGGVMHRVYAKMVHDWADTDAPPNLGGWKETRPLVIINGCHTTALGPEEMLSFVSAFGFARASGVLGTEVAVLLEVAVEFAESFLRRVAAGEAVGDSLYAVRWDLADRGNLLGLAYSLFSRSDLKLLGPRA